MQIVTHMRRGLAQATLRVITTLSDSAKARRTALGLFAVIAYLLIGRLIEPGFTRYWWYQLGQTSGILVMVLTLDTVFAREGGVSWQTHGIVLMTTYADVAGTANNLYDRFGPYDKIVHFWSGAALAAGTYEVLRLLDRRGAISIAPLRRAVLAIVVSFTIAGFAWELYEQFSDDIFNSGRVQSRKDTQIDLVADALGAAAAAVLLRLKDARRQQFVAEARHETGPRELTSQSQ